MIDITLLLFNLGVIMALPLPKEENAYFWLCVIYTALAIRHALWYLGALRGRA